MPDWLSNIVSTPSAPSRASCMRFGPPKGSPMIWIFAAPSLFGTPESPSIHTTSLGRTIDSEDRVEVTRRHDVVAVRLTVDRVDVQQIDSTRCGCRRRHESLRHDGRLQQVEMILAVPVEEHGAVRVPTLGCRCRSAAPCPSVMPGAARGCRRVMSINGPTTLAHR